MPPQLQLKDVAKGREWHRMEEIVTEIGYREVEDAVDLFRNVIESVIRCKAPLHVIVCLYDYVQSCMDLARPALKENDRDYLLAYKIWGRQKNMAHNNSNTVTGSVMHDAMAKSEVDVLDMLLSIVSDSILLVQDKRQMLSNRYLLHASCSMLGPLCIPRLIYDCDRDSIQRRDSTGRWQSRWLIRWCCTRND